MSNKSLFEKLFEEVMESDEQALGIESTPEGGEGVEGGGEFGEEEGGDEVTLTLDRSTAQALYDILGGVLGGGEEEMGGEEEGGMGEEEGGMGGEGEEQFGGDESSESWDKEEKEEDSEEDSEDDELQESPRAEYENFPNKGESLRNRNQVVSGALAAKTSGQGKAEKTSQTSGTEKYMPFSTKYDDGKSMKAKGRAANVSGPGKSVFHP